MPDLDKVLRDNPQLRPPADRKRAMAERDGDDPAREKLAEAFVEVERIAGVLGEVAAGVVRVDPALAEKARDARRALVS